MEIKVFFYTFIVFILMYVISEILGDNEYFAQKYNGGQLNTLRDKQNEKIQIREDEMQNEEVMYPTTKIALSEDPFNIQTSTIFATMTELPVTSGIPTTPLMPRCLNFLDNTTCSYRTDCYWGKEEGLDMCLDKNSIQCENAPNKDKCESQRVVKTDPDIDQSCHWHRVKNKCIDSSPIFENIPINDIPQYAASSAYPDLFYLSKNGEYISSKNIPCDSVRDDDPNTCKDQEQCHLDLAKNSLNLKDICSEEMPTINNGADITLKSAYAVNYPKLFYLKNGNLISRVKSN